MARVKVKQLEAGKQLSEDVVGTNGRLLLKSGTILETKHLAIFRTWGVVEVDIVGDEAAPEEPDVDFDSLPDSVKIAILQRLKGQFRHCDLMHPLIRELIAHRTATLARETAKRGGTPP